MWRHLLVFSGQSRFPCFTIANFQLGKYPWQPNFSNHIKLKLKTSISIPGSIVKTEFRAAVWHHFPAVTRPVRCSLFYNGQPSIRWARLARKLHQTEAKHLITSQEILKDISFKLLSDFFFPLLPGQSVIPCFTMVNLQLAEYPWQPNFSNCTKSICSF